MPQAQPGEYPQDSRYDGATARNTKERVRAKADEERQRKGCADRHHTGNDPVAGEHVTSALPDSADQFKHSENQQPCKRANAHPGVGLRQQGTHSCQADDDGPSGRNTRRQEGGSRGCKKVEPGTPGENVNGRRPPKNGHGSKHQRDAGAEKYGLPERGCRGRG